MSAIVDSDMRGDEISRVGEQPVFVPETFLNPPWDERADYPAMRTCLTEGKLIYSYPMKDFLDKHHKIARFNNEVHYGILEHQGKCVAVAYKPKSPEQVSAAHAESIAYEIYENMIAPHTGNHPIPPTVVRPMPDGRIASCQFFVETEDAEDMWQQDFRDRVVRQGPQELITEMSVFNSVFNDWDRHPGNYLATQREGRIHFASIDNESIENRGLLQKWGERSYIPVAFTDSSAAQEETTLTCPQGMTLEGFKTLLQQYGFTDVPRVKVHFNNLTARGEGHRICLIKDGCLMIPFHYRSPVAFPLPRGPYHPSLIRAYERLNRGELERHFQPLVALDRDRFKSRVNEILARRDLFLEAARSEEQKR